jgi:hypothetical protein
MRVGEGRVIEIHLDAQGDAAAWISCPERMIPAPGQDLLAWSVGDPQAPLARPVFPAEYQAGKFLCAPGAPESWEPGTPLRLYGPLGHGFAVHGRIDLAPQRLVLVGLGKSPARLLPLALRAAREKRAVTLFSAGPLHNLPPEVELLPPEDLSKALRWADFIALDVPIAELSGLRHALGLAPSASLPCPAQVLVSGPMPCSGSGTCGVCAVPGKKAWKLACKDGPVFNLSEIEF